MKTIVADLFEFLEIESTTGIENKAVEWLVNYLKRFDWKAQIQEIDKKRSNVIVIGNSMKVLFCSHIDTVPPYIEPQYSADKTKILGRGSSDAKGVILAQIHAANQLIKQGKFSKEEIGFAYVVGEEVDHIGAKAAAKSLKDLSIPHIFIGEPTQNKLCKGGLGLLKIEIKVEGKIGHSAFIKSGRSANHEIIDFLSHIEETCGKDEAGILGQTTVNIGVIEGGVASNVFAPSASALILYRLAEPSNLIITRLEELRKKYAPHGLYKILSKFEPIRFEVVEGIETTIARFNSDASFFSNDNTKLYLIGPGDIQVAHSENEFLSIESLKNGIETYVDVASKLV